MYLRELNILNYKNIEETTLSFSPKINCFIGHNGMGKTNVLDAIYFLSFCKSAFQTLDSQCIRHEADFAMLQGKYAPDEEMEITVGLKRGQKKQFRKGKKEYKRLIEHIGLIPLVMVSPKDNELIVEGSDERRRFMDIFISQQDKVYLQHLTNYNSLLKQRNALLKQYAETEPADWTIFEILEQQMVPLADYIYRQREAFIESFIPLFQQLYDYIADSREQVRLCYRSQLQERDLTESFVRTRQRDLILGWTSQGIHKDDLEMYLGEYPLKQVGSQGQQKTYLIALKLAQAALLETNTEADKPILLLDDIFDKLDAQRVEKIVELVNSDRFGQIFITDTDRQHLVEILRTHQDNSRIFNVEDGKIAI